MTHLLRKLWVHDEGQDIAEYAVMLAVILVLVVGDHSLSRKQCEQRIFERSQFNSMTPATSISLLL